LSTLPAMVVALAAGVLSLVACAAEPPVEVEKLRFEGALHEPEDLSAVEILGDLLIVGSDEGERIQLLRAQEDGSTYEVLSEGIALIPSGEEIDIEGLAREERTVYVLGSHAIKRRRIRPEQTWAENRQRLATVEPEAPRHRIFRVEIDPASGRPEGPVKSISLRTLLERDPILAPFTLIPGKENGVNIEGIAVRNEKLYLGFRSPVLREGFVPVMVLDYDEPGGYELRFVQLAGRGIRAMAPVRDGFLVLAGFARSGGRPYALFFWDGEDQIPGRDVTVSHARLLAKWPLEAGGDAEGLAVLSESDEEYTILVVHDVVPGGAPVRARIKK
jgi:hypothetical protein